jgi:beta-ureidopropionase / N-carbamoyl-L-amino-acid hydrolase
MNRRQFNLSLLGTLGAWTLGTELSASQPASSVSIKGRRIIDHLRELAEFGKNPEGGVSRVAYSDADLNGREYTTSLMRQAGLEVHIDVAGNIIGRKMGSDPSLPPLSFGSHIDSVPQGGNYDGPLGSLGAIEVVETLNDHRMTTRHPLEVIIFQNEEGGKTGSRALIGALSTKDLERVTHSGKSIREGIRFLGGDPDRLDEVRRKPGDIAAFLELHIEQGGVLEKEEIDIGVVEGIVGIKRWYINVEGVANHAGTTPMNVRRDALLAAARFIQTVNRVVMEVPGSQVGTVGQIEASPGAPNVVPGRVRMSLEIRDLDMAKIDDLYRQIEKAGGQIASDSGTSFSFDPIYASEGAPTDERLRQLVEDSAKQLGSTSLRMPSGAGHDAQSMAKLGPVGMIFVPSVGGISHSPKELTRDEDVIKGVNVLFHTVLKADVEM